MPSGFTIDIGNKGGNRFFEKKQNLNFYTKAQNEVRSLIPEKKLCVQGKT